MTHICGGEHGCDEEVCVWLEQPRPGESCAVGHRATLAVVVLVVDPAPRPEWSRSPFCPGCAEKWLGQLHPGLLDSYRTLAN